MFSAVKEDVKSMGGFSGHRRSSKGNERLGKGMKINQLISAARI
jgi:hypothetical protein